MTTQHTQAPWVAAKNACEWSVERNAVGSVEYQPICDADGKIVAFAVDYSNRAFAELNTDHAHLIASAPELLECLQEMISEVRWWESEHECCAGKSDVKIQKAMAAIAKATGVSNG